MAGNNWLYWTLLRNYNTDPAVVQLLCVLAEHITADTPYLQPAYSYRHFTPRHTKHMYRVGWLVRKPFWVLGLRLVDFGWKIRQQSMQAVTSDVGPFWLVFTRKSKFGFRVGLKKIRLAKKAGLSSFPVPGWFKMACNSCGHIHQQRGPGQKQVSRTIFISPRFGGTCSCLLHPACCLLLVVHYLLLAVWCLLVVVCCLLHVAWCG